MTDDIDPRILLKRLEAEHAKRISENWLATYAPYPKQALFHALGATHRERLFRAANQVGKTLGGGAEIAMHATGLYPPWWDGKRFDRPTVCWVGGVTAEATRDGAQRILLGRTGAHGTGTIPARAFTGSPLARQGVADACAIAKCKHVTGGTSSIIFKSYDQGREKWQGDTVHVVWFDEEPPEDIYTEGLTRTNASNGIVFLTFTPLLGYSTVVSRFLKEVNASRADINMTIEEAPHFSPEKRQEIIDSYPEHEREARTLGIPSSGSGRVYPVTQAAIAWGQTELPKGVRRIIGLDFGWDHPTAAVWLSYDLESDTIYVTDAYRRSKQLPEIYVASIKARSKQAKIPVAWPHDGLNHDKTSGIQIAVQYRDLGLDMLPERAQFIDGGNGVGAGISEILSRMETGRFKVASHLEEWFEEFRLYHREPKGALGVPFIVKVNDDLMDATRYGVMSIRFAQVVRPKEDGYKSTKPQRGRKLGYRMIQSDNPRICDLLQAARERYPQWDIWAEIFDHGEQVGICLRRKGQETGAWAVRRRMQGFGEVGMADCIAECEAQIMKWEKKDGTQKGD